MNLTKPLKRSLMATAVAALAFTLFHSSAHANVYATNIKLDDGLTNAVVPAATNVSISYILNEPASAGVTVQIQSGAAVVRTLSFTNGPGAQAGLNSIVWDGRDNGSNLVASGTYAVSITTGSAGYPSWTQITSDSDTTYVYSGRGIAVDKNTNSPYYGRIFVANSTTGFGTRNGDRLGILKYNADGSPADEGMFSADQDGHTWAGLDVSPWKVTVSADDRVYVDDLANNGEVFSWDPTFSSNTVAYVLTTNNQPANAHLTGLAVTGTGTNAQVWMANNTADNTSPNGILTWGLSNGGTCVTNDQGTNVVVLGDSLTQGPQAVVLDASGNIYTCQAVFAPGDPAQRVFRFSATNTLPAQTADWAVGTTNDNYGGASGMAVDPTGTYLAVSFEGVLAGGLFSNGNTKVLYATNGAVAAELDLGVAMDGEVDTEHQDTDCAWDAVGNVYYVDNWYGYWRVFSPPGANQATTVAPMIIQVGSPTPPVITGLSVNAGTVTIRFTGSAADTAGSFTLLSAGNPAGSYGAASGATVTQVSAGVFQATVPAAGPMQFYRISK